MQINGVELEFHLFDPDFKEQKNRYYEVLKQIMNSEKAGNTEDQIRKECGQVKQLFDATFGEGTGEKVCGKGNDHLVCLEAYTQLVNEQIRQCDRYKEMKDTLSEYKA